MKLARGDLPDRVYFWFWIGSSPTPLPRQQVVSLSQFSCVSPVELTGGRGVMGGVKSHYRKKALPSISNSVLSGRGPQTDTLFDWSDSGLVAKRRLPQSPTPKRTTLYWSSLQSVLRIHDILVRIRISVHMANGSGSCYFRQWPSRWQLKTFF
jgi:hypothetical protein